MCESLFCAGHSTRIPRGTMPTCINAKGWRDGHRNCSILTLNIVLSMNRMCIMTFLKTADTFPVSFISCLSTFVLLSPCLSLHCACPATIARDVDELTVVIREWPKTCFHMQLVHTYSRIYRCLHAHTHTRGRIYTLTNICTSIYNEKQHAYQEEYKNGEIISYTCRDADMYVYG